MTLKYNYLVLFFSIFYSISSFAQQKEIAIAKSYEVVGRFSEALQYYKKAEARDKYLGEEERADLYKSLIFCYDKEKDVKNAVKYFEKIEKLEPLSDSLNIKYAELLRTNGEFIKSVKVYMDLANKQTDARLKKNMLSTLGWYNKNKTTNQPYKVAKTKINVNGLSMGMEQYKDGIIIGMPKTTDGQVFYDLGFCKKIDSVNFSTPEILSKKLTSKFHDGYPSYDKNNNILYFTSNSLTKLKVKKGSKKDKELNGIMINRLKIYQSVFTNGEWSEKEELPFNSSAFDCLHPSISADGKTMFFTSNQEGGIGGYDIYKVKKEGNSWSSPINLGTQVNSMGDEMTPFVIEETLYFGSRGYFGFGGIDIFKVNLNDAEANIQNLGKPINTKEDDFSFSINEEAKGYLSSNRGGKKAGDKIYSFTYYPVNVVTDKENGERVEDIDVVISEKEGDAWKEVSRQKTNAKGEWKYNFEEGKDYKVKLDNSYRNSKEIEISGAKDLDEQLKQLQNTDLQRVFIDGYVIDEVTQEGIEGVKETLFEKMENGELEEIDSTFTDSEGYWRFDVEKDKTYEVEIERVDYELQKIEIEPIEDNEPQRKTYTTKLKVVRNADDEKVLDADNIYFELNSATIKTESYKVLDQVVAYLKANPYSKLEIGAHTDCTGDNALNLALSNRRAEACSKYVIKNIGGKAFRVKHKGYGETKSLNPCAEQEANKNVAAKNRRVEFKLVR